MTDAIKGALAKVKAQKENFGFMDRFDVDENYVVMEALEKQIPIKPTLIEDKMYMCPRCYNNLMFKWEQYPTVLNSHIGLRYCLGCGQRIDWSCVDKGGAE